MKRFLLGLLLIIKFDVCFSQQKDDLTGLLKQVKEASYYDSVRLFTIGEKAKLKAGQISDESALSEIDLYYGNYFFYIRNLERARYYFERSLSEATKANDEHLKILSNIRLSFLSYETGEKETGEKELLTLLDQSKKISDYENIAELLNLIGITKEESNKPREAIKLYMEGLVLSETKNLNYYPAVFRNNLGLIKYFSGQVADALEDFTKSLEIAEKENNKRLASHIEINICVAYVSTNKLKEVQPILNKVLHYFRSNNLPQELAAAFLNISSAFSGVNKNETALLYTDSAIIILQKHDLNNELTRAYLNKTDILIKLKNDKEAELALDKAKLLAEETGSLEDISACHLLSYQLNSYKNKYKEALADYIAYEDVKDSLDRSQVGKMVKEMQLKYNLQKKETELEKEKTKTLLLEAKNQRERFLRWLTIGISLGVLLILISMFYLRYLKKIREQQEHFSRQLIENAEGERLRIARDLHDDIGQSLSMIKSKISAGKVEGAQNLEGELGRVIEQTREISKNLYPSYLEKIGLVRSVARLVENIQSASRLECSFEIADEVDSLPINIKTHLYRILQECVNNTIKHSGATALKVSIFFSGNEYQLTYQDNGKGSEDTKTGNGIGMFSIRERAKIINGILHIDDKSHKGFKLSIKFKD
jgi:two-component system, NarL family, sensor kinase